MPPCSNTGAVARSHYGNAAPEGSRERDQSSSAYYRKMSVFNESCRVWERSRASTTFLFLSLSLPSLLYLSSTSTLLPLARISSPEFELPLFFPLKHCGLPSPFPLFHQILPSHLSPSLSLLPLLTHLPTPNTDSLYNPVPNLATHLNHGFHFCFFLNYMTHIRYYASQRWREKRKMRKEGKYSLIIDSWSICRGL